MNPANVNNTVGNVFVNIATYVGIINGPVGMSGHIFTEYDGITPLVLPTGSIPISSSVILEGNQPSNLDLFCSLGTSDSINFRLLDQVNDTRKIGGKPFTSQTNIIDETNNHVYGILPSGAPLLINNKLIFKIIVLL